MDAPNSPPDAQPQENTSLEISSISAIPVQKTPPLFEKRDPPEPSDLQDHPHEKIFPAEQAGAAALRYGWSLIGASRRGDSHGHQAKYREDDFAIRLLFTDQQNQVADAALIALADGVGGSSCSRWGARAAVLGATQSLPEGPLIHFVREVRKGRDVRPYTGRMFYGIRERAYQAIARRAGAQNCPLSDLYSTLQVFLVIPLDHERLFLASTQIGDGALYILHANAQVHEHPGDFWETIQEQQIQGESNEVLPFTQSDPETWQRYLRCDLSLSVSFLMAMTDGTADDIQAPYPTQEIPEPDRFFFVREFYQYLAKTVFEHEAPAQALLQFLYYEQAQSRDDRTLICLFRDRLPVS